MNKAHIDGVRSAKITELHQDIRTLSLAMDKAISVKTSLLQRSYKKLSSLLDALVLKNYATLKICRQNGMKYWASHQESK